jgi:hypothetical protein
MSPIVSLSEFWALFPDREYNLSDHVFGFNNSESVAVIAGRTLTGNIQFSARRDALTRLMSTPKRG